MKIIYKVAKFKKIYKWNNDSETFHVLSNYLVMARTSYVTGRKI